MKINNKYGYVRVSSRTQESNSSIQSQKQQLIQNGIEEENIFVHSKNQFQVCFVGENSYWRGTLLHFSGINATRFYFFLKEKIIDLTIFSSAVIFPLS